MRSQREFWTHPLFVSFQNVLRVSKNVVKYHLIFKKYKKRCIKTTFQKMDKVILNFLSEKKEKIYFECIKILYEIFLSITTLL